MPRKRVPRIRLCDFCGNTFGIERGPAAKTCSPECERDRNNAREQARYQRVKDTPEWQATRTDYLNRLKERAARDPAFAEILARNHRKALRRFRAALAQDPDRLEAVRAAGREWHHQRTPEQRAARKYWYGNLSLELKQLFLLDLRQQRAYERLKELNMAFKWPEDKTHLLGTKPDVAIADELGCTAAIVAYHRKRLGIPTYEEPSTWSDEHNHLLGTMTDTALAEQVGCSAYIVAYQRKKQGISAYKVPDMWDESNDHLLGSMPDAALAKKLGTQLHTIYKRRQKLGIPPAGREGNNDWTPEEEALLGTDSDYAIAERLGRSRPSVIQRRHRLGIPAHYGRFSEKKTEAGRDSIHITEELRAKMEELHEPLLKRYRDAGLPMDKLQPWQIVEIALNELLHSVRKNQARQRSGV